MERPKFVILETPHLSEAPENEAYIYDAVADSIKRGEVPFVSHLLDSVPKTPEQRHEEAYRSIALGRYALTTAVYEDLGTSPEMLNGIRTAHKNGREVSYRSLFRNFRVQGWD